MKEDVCKVTKTCGPVKEVKKADNLLNEDSVRRNKKMIAKNLISDIIPSLRTSDTGKKALIWMEIFRISHLPIVNNEEFLGLISDNDIYDLNMADTPIGNHNLSLIKPYVYDTQHIFEIIAVISKLKLTVIPVLNQDKKYLGAITSYDLLHRFANLTATQDPGGLIVLEMHLNDYALSEISQIVESNNAKILSLYVDSPENDSMKLEVTLKINRMDLSAIIQTFERYGYKIKSTYGENEDISSLYEQRYESFINYLNI